MTVRTNDFERNSEENLIFAMIINLFKNDQNLPDRASKKNVNLKLILNFYKFLDNNFFLDYAVSKFKDKINN